MTEDFNPFDPDNFSTGLGWDGKTVTVTQSRFEVDLFTNSDGSPWTDDNGEQGYSNVWAISGISEDSDFERTVKYSIGKTLVPTSDGDSFESKSGKPNQTFNAKAKAAKLVRAFKESEFDLSRLMSEGKPSAKGLNGAMFLYKSTQPIDPKTKEPAVDKGGYAKVDEFPVKFLGWSKASPQSAKVDDAISIRAENLISELLTAAEGNKLTRIQVIQGLNKALAGDPDMNTIVSLAVKADFNSAAPWKVEGTTISLS